SEKKRESKKGKNRKAQVEACTKQKVDDLDVRGRDFKGTSESEILKSQRQNSSCMGKLFMFCVLIGKTKKDVHGQGFPDQKKDMSWKPEAEELMLSLSGLETKAPDAEQSKTKVMTSEDLPMPSAEPQQKPTPKKNLGSSKYLQSDSKASQPLVHMKQTAKQKRPKDTAAKRLAESPNKKLKKSVKKSSNKKPQLQREEGSDNGEESYGVTQLCSGPAEVGLEREPVKLHTLQSPGGASNKTPVKALHHLTDSMKKSGKDHLSTEFSGKIPKKICCRTNKGVRSSPEDAESQTDSDSSSVQDTASKKQKLPDVKIKNNIRKRNKPRGLHGPVLEHCDKYASRSKFSEQDSTSSVSDNSEDLNFPVKELLDNIARHKIVMPTNTPNVRRTKRIRLRPLEYWRGERVNYSVRPSGELVINGIVCPETKRHRKIKQRRDGHQKKRDETRSKIPANLDHSVVDTSKLTVVLDPKTNEEVLVECINTESSHTCFFKDDSVEIYKNLNTPAFAVGRLILKPLKEKGQQFVHMDTIAFHIIYGKVIVTLHKTSYLLTTGHCFYVPAGNVYNIRNLLNEESVLLFTQLK
ncbi:CENPC protein, partial [Pedionomus torquatus]|nr:CENPC protein [Pedionomus torquatus]